MNIGDLFDKRIPIAITAVLLLQAGTAIWWAATKDTEDRFEAERIAALEQASEKTADRNAQVIERLARIEERVNAEAETLDRIEQKIGNLKP